MTDSKIKLTWNKGFLSNTYYIKSNDQTVGKYNDKSLSNTSYATFKNKNYKFKAKGFFSQTTDIIDLSNDNIIGEITHNSWFNKAKICLNGKIYNFKTDNFWNTKHSIYDYENSLIKYSNSYTSGEINSNTDNDVLILSGLCAINYYWQVLFIVFILLIVIL
ncbi:hypothetical protein [Flavobacteriaceae bacterium 14752]|uniref:hypothetical protein n=1 Tax=Mesohalobacter salilacus TaxID=2491711 RepID=UPI000F6439BA|nr:hypothetical protein EIG84_06920 [Flavobacteriaceae bacterium 14752]